MIIKEVTLWTGNLEKTRSYYRDKMELEISAEAPGQFAVKIGTTKVTFHAVDTPEKPYYHLAFNIPAQQFAEAKAWAKSRLALNEVKGEDEVFFESWNAHAFYFEDPSGNLLEFIARHNLDHPAEVPFSASALLGVSEVGIVTDEVLPLVRQLNDWGIPGWGEGNEGFTPVGDETGLGIVVKRGRQWFFSNLIAEFYPLEIQVEGIGRISFPELNKVKKI
ncbi:ring-cleaving dioxygenase [Bacillus sp. FJAT-27264]|uniref:VOC family protein n=1 Tax=Paenibacillus sp. (strain DSM 101736 / FJAT-27264) TaxID=1850362 RepID=UPI000807E661|nr:VOC family protein [Bacillus sp. FJAT-27264]OBZ14289.1 ring-cleaving dioxygenase [Bacillus sp. FJAT-27264]